LPKGTLEKAYVLLGKRKFKSVIILLEPMVLEYRDNQRFYKTLSLAYLYIGDYGGAEPYVRRARQLGPEDPDVDMALAALYLRRREITKALQIWLEVRNRYLDYKKAKIALDLVKKLGTADEGDKLLMDSVFPIFLPPLPKRIPWVPLFFILGFTISFGILTYALIQNPQVFNSWWETPGNPLRPKIRAVTLEQGIDLISYQGEYRTYYTTQEVRQIFNQGKAYFDEYRDNKAIIEMNKLLLSNAHPLVKDRARLLVSYSEAPDFEGFQDNPTFNQIKNDPLLYHQTYLMWRGRIANLKIEEQNIQFDFLVGYDEGQVLEGIVPTTIDFPVLLQNNQGIQIIAQVQATDDQQFFLKGHRIHKITPGP